MNRPLKITAIVVLSALVITGAAAAAYWHSLKDTPQYSLALVIDAAKRDDRAELNELVDVDAIADNFTPEVTSKAVELYGKGLSPDVIARLRTIAQPVMPAVKERARAALPRLIRDRISRFDNVPFAVLVLGADRYLRVTQNGREAIVESTIPERPLRLRMTHDGDRWKVTAFEDDALATEIARRIGEELIAIASAGDAKNGANALGIGGLSQLLREAESILQ
jgi:hypothetical protein